MEFRSKLSLDIFNAQSVDNILNIQDGEILETKICDGDRGS